MTQKWLLPVDGSEASLHAVRLAIEEASTSPARPDFLLVNVQAPVTGDVSRFINADTLREFHDENGTAAMAGARRLLDAAGLPYTARVLVGEAAPTIADLAARDKCTRIVMGARGLGSVIGMLMGSVTTAVVHLSPVPVLLVK
jgi:nucleotide-binding universal stress UspA family protein